MAGQMWFGTEERMQWIPAPLAGAEMSPVGFSAGGTMIGGGGYQVNSFGSHKEYDFSWGKSSSIDASQLMQSYKSGIYGRGLIHFIDPHSYERNVLPIHWSSPGMALDDEAPKLIRTRDIPVTGVATPSGSGGTMPVRSAEYLLIGAANGYPGAWDSLYLPVPQGYTLFLGAVYTATGGGGVFVAPASSGGVGTPLRLAELPVGASNLTPTIPAVGSRGVRIWVGRSGIGGGSVTLTALVGRMVRTSSLHSSIAAHAGGGSGVGPYSGAIYPDCVYENFKPGMGNTGCRFDGTPTYVPFGGADGGQASYGVRLREVGAWVY